MTNEKKRNVQQKSQYHNRQQKQSPQTAIANQLQNKMFNRLKKSNRSTMITLVTGEVREFSKILDSDNFSITGIELGNKNITMIYKHAIAEISRIPLTKSEAEAHL